MPNDQPSFTQILIEARQKLGLTQAEVATRAGIAPNTYARIERGERGPGGDNLLAIATALKLDPMLLRRK